MSSGLHLAGAELRYFVSDAIGHINHEHHAKHSACFGRTPVHGLADVPLCSYVGFAAFSEPPDVAFLSPVALSAVMLVIHHHCGHELASELFLFLTIQTNRGFKYHIPVFLCGRGFLQHLVTGLVYF